MDSRKTFPVLRYDYDEVGSTNDVAFVKGAEGAPEGTVIVAKKQTSGRGRMSRKWISTPEDGLYASFLLRPPKSVLDSEDACYSLGVLPLAAGLAVTLAMREGTKLDALLKWPNDVLVEGKKIAGVLSEVQFPSADEIVVVVGIGLNLSYPKDSWPDELKGKVSSLSDFGVSLSRDKAIEMIGKELYFWYEKFIISEKGIIEEIQSLSATNGKKVRIHGIGRDIEGTAVRVEPNGALLVKKEDGETELVQVGDVELLSVRP